MYELTLSPAEIKEITKYERYTKQQHQLRLHGIPFVIGPKKRTHSSPQGYSTRSDNDAKKHLNWFLLNPILRR
ncbi:DUF4224 domain-containing protein [Escherichia coli]|nr:DUF4224 domain-containing protein [Escherichia coli]